MNEREIPSQQKALAVLSGNQRTLDALVQVFNGPVFSKKVREGEEPVNDLEAARWKLAEVEGSPQIPAYASDVSCVFDNETNFSVKPNRDDQYLTKNAATGVPEKIYERYGRSEGTNINWFITYALKFGAGDESLRYSRLKISCHVPQLAPEVIESYYSGDSSAGLLLVKLIQDYYQDLPFLCTNVDDNTVLSFDWNMAWGMIVDKVLPKELFRKLLNSYQPNILIPDEPSQAESNQPIFAEKSQRQQGEAVALPVIDFIRRQPKISVEERLKDGSLVHISWVAESDVEDVSALLYDNFDHSPSYAELSSEARGAYKNANTPDQLKADCARESVIAALLARDENQEVVGFILVTNGTSRSFAGEPAAIIKRTHTRIGTVGNGLGSKMLKISEEMARAANLKVLGVGASGKSARYFESKGFETVEIGDNPVIKHRDNISVQWQWLEKQLQ